MSFALDDADRVGRGQVLHQERMLDFGRRVEQKSRFVPGNQAWGVGRLAAFEQLIARRGEERRLRLRVAKKIAHDVQVGSHVSSPSSAPARPGSSSTSRQVVRQMIRLSAFPSIVTRRMYVPAPQSLPAWSLKSQVIVRLPAGGSVSATSCRT